MDELSPSCLDIAEAVPVAAADAPTDGELLDRFRLGGDREALATLLARHAEGLGGLARRITRDADLADDALQQAVLVLLDRRRAGRLGPVAEVRPWLMTIVANVGRNLLRTEARSRRRADAAPLPAPSPGPALDADERGQVQALLADLHPRQRLAIELHVVDGLPHAEVAAALACDPRTAGRLVERGLEHLRLLLTRRGLALSAVAALALLPRATTATDSATVLTRTATTAVLPPKAAFGGLAAAALVAAAALGAGTAVALQQRSPAAPAPIAPAPAAPAMAPPAPGRRVVFDEDFSTQDRWVLRELVPYRHAGTIAWQRIALAAPLAQLVSDPEIPGHVLELDPTTIGTNALLLEVARSALPDGLLGRSPWQVRVRLCYLPLADAPLPDDLPRGWHEEVWQVDTLEQTPRFDGVGGERHAPRPRALNDDAVHIIQRMRVFPDGRVEALPREVSQLAGVRHTTLIKLRGARVRLERVLITAD
jgi:RNA polymerase sigma-70 factor (ECF subfamily)